MVSNNHCNTFSLRETQMVIRIQHCLTVYTSTNIVHLTVNTCKVQINSLYPGCKWLIQCTECSCTCATVHTRLQFLAIQVFLIASVMYSGFMQPCNSSRTMGGRCLGYGLALYTPITCHHVCILGNDCPGMGTVARLHKFTVIGCMHTAWWYIFVHGNM